MKNVSQWFIRSYPTSKRNEMTEVILSPTGSIRCISNTSSHWRRIWPNYNQLSNNDPTTCSPRWRHRVATNLHPRKTARFFNRTFLSEVSFPPKPPRKNTHTHTHTHTHRFRRICCSPIITYSWLDNPPFFLYIKYRCTSSRGNAGYPATDSWWILRILPATWFTKA